MYLQIFFPPVGTASKWFYQRTERQIDGHGKTWYRVIIGHWKPKKRATIFYLVEHPSKHPEPHKAWLIA